MTGSRFQRGKLIILPVRFRHRAQLPGVQRVVDEVLHAEVARLGLGPVEVHNNGTKPRRHIAKKTTWKIYSHTRSPVTQSLICSRRKSTGRSGRSPRLRGRACPPPYHRITCAGLTAY